MNWFEREGKLFVDTEKYTGDTIYCVDRLNFMAEILPLWFWFVVKRGKNICRQ